MTLIPYGIAVFKFTDVMERFILANRIQEPNPNITDIAPRQGLDSTNIVENISELLRTRSRINIISNVSVADRTIDMLPTNPFLLVLALAWEFVG